MTNTIKRLKTWKGVEQHYTPREDAKTMYERIEAEMNECYENILKAGYELPKVIYDVKNK